MNMYPYYANMYKFVLKSHYLDKMIHILFDSRRRDQLSINEMIRVPHTPQYPNQLLQHGDLRNSRFETLKFEKKNSFKAEFSSDVKKLIKSHLNGRHTGPTPGLN